MKCNYGRTQNCQLFAGVLMELNLYQVEAVLKLKSTGWWWNILNRGINANRVTFFGSFMPLLELCGIVISTRTSTNKLKR
jgi:hypothetical protein